MKNIYVTLFLFLSTLSYTQTISQDETDIITKQKILKVNASRYYEWKPIDNITNDINKKIYLSLLKIGEENLLQLEIHDINTLRCLSNKSKLIIFFDDNTSLDLTNKLKTKCDKQALSGDYSIEFDEIKKIGNSNIKEIQINFSEGIEKFMIKKEKKGTIKNTAKLFIEKTK